MPRIDADGINFFYQQRGEGPDVVLLHGITGNMAIWPLIDLIDNLTAEFRVTYYDLRGHGYSDTLECGYTSADMADDFRRIGEALGLGPAYVLGHSFGGVVAAHAAVLFPERVRGLILSDPFFPCLRRLGGDITAWEGWDGYVARSARHGIRVTPENWWDVGDILRQAAELTGEGREKFVGELGEPALERLVRLAATTCGRDTAEVAGLTEERLASIQQPTLALFGEHSPFLSTSQWLQANLPNCRSTTVPDAEHLAHEENPAQFVKIVARELRRMAT